MASMLLQSPQTRWAVAPEMQDADGPDSELTPPTSARSYQPLLTLQESGRYMEGELDTDVDVEAAQQCLIARPRAPRARKSGVAPIITAVLLLVGVAAFFYTQKPVSMSTDGHVSLMLGPVSASGGSALAQQAMQGQPFVYVLDASSFKKGDAVILGQGTESEEVHKVEESHVESGAIRLYHGLQFMHEEGSGATASAYTQEISTEHEKHPYYLYSRFSATMAFGTTMDDTQVRLNEKCYQFEVGDEVELSSRHKGHYEFNMVTGITFDEADGTCLFHLAYPIAYSHSSTAEISKMIPEDWQLLPTPAPESEAPTPAPPPTSQPTPVPTGPVPIAKDVCDLDADGDGKITKKEALADPEVAARIPCLDEDGDSMVSAKQCASYTSLDSDGDGCISKAEAANDQCMKEKFSDWDKDGDGCLSQKELEKAALGSPQIVFVIKNIDYAGFSADRELYESKRQQSEDLIGGNLDNVDEGHVLVKLSAGSVRVDAYIDGDTSQVEKRRPKIESELYTLFTADPAMQPYIDGPVKAASISEPKPVTATRPSLSLIVAAIACLLALLAVALFFLRPGERPVAPIHSKWIPPPDIIVVPGGGLGKDGALSLWMQERLKVAKQIHDEANQVKTQQVELTGETWNTMFISDTDRPITKIVTMCEGIRFGPRDHVRGNNHAKLESHQAKEFLEKLGVTSEDITTDDLSLDTLGNAYFLRTTHNDVFQARDVVVVTNEFHMARTQAIFDKVFNLGPFPVEHSEYMLRYEPVADRGVDIRALKKRGEWERQQLQEFEESSKQWTDLHDVHSLIFAGEEVPEPVDNVARRSLPRSFTRMKLKGNEGRHLGEKSRPCNLQSEGSDDQHDP